MKATFGCIAAALAMFATNTLLAGTAGIDSAGRQDPDQAKQAAIELRLADIKDDEPALPRGLSAEERL